MKTTAGLTDWRCTCDNLPDETSDAPIQSCSCFRVMLQVELCYKCGATMMQYGRYCQARACMNETIGAWIEEHAVSFSAPYQRAFSSMIGAGDSPR